MDPEVWLDRTQFFQTLCLTTKETHGFKIEIVFQEAALIQRILQKVSKFQKQIFLILFSPKTSELFFDCCPKDLKWVKSKTKPLFYIKYPLINMINCLHFLFNSFQRLGQKSKNNFNCFLEELRTRKFASEIYWPLQIHFFIQDILLIYCDAWKFWPIATLKSKKLSCAFLVYTNKCLVIFRLFLS